MVGLLLAALLSLSASAQEIGGVTLPCFLGLNEADTAAVIPPCESSDLLNVESNLGGTAILKRKGFAKSADLTVSTASVTGSHSFIDSSGNRLDIVCHDRYCAKSTNGNAFANFLSTAGGAGAVPTRWSFVDVGGKLYGGNDKRDPILQYDGTTLSYPATMPAGSILEMTQDRMVVGDISGNPNRVHYSSGGAFTQFTTGVNPEDSFFDDIGAPGDKVRGLKYLNGNLYIFKTASITSCSLANQYNTQCGILSPNIGTTDPGSIVAAGSSIFFRAQDKNYWELSPRGLSQISKKIPNLVKSQSGGLGGGENSNTQTTQADWQAGTQNPTASWNTTTIPGSIFPSSSTVIDASTASFILGSWTVSGAASTPTVFASSFSAAQWFTNSGFESNSKTLGWSVGATGNMNGGALCGPSSTGNFTWGKTYSVVAGGCSSPATVTDYVNIINSGTGALLYTTTFTASASQGCNYTTLNISTQPVNMAIVIGQSAPTSVFVASSPVFSSGIIPSGILEYGQGFGFPTPGVTCGIGQYNASIFDFAEPYFVANSTFTSQPFDTSFTTPTWGPANSPWIAPSGSVLFSTLVSSVQASSYDNSIPVSTGAKVLSAEKRYIKYAFNFINTISSASVAISSVSIAYATTGQFVVQCIQPNSSISAFGTLSCAQTIAGSGSIVFYTTTNATCAALPTQPPVNAAGAVQFGWTAQTNNATVTTTPNTAVYIGWRSLLGSATDQAQVDSCILSWNEGTPTQPAWATYDSVKNAIYWTTTINGAASTNRLLKYDRNLEQWYPFDIPAQAPKIINNSLYFGGASSGTWNLYGGVDADVGYGVTGYWTSKDFGSDRPFQGKSFKMISALSRNNGNGSVTGTWTLSNSQTGSYSISLATGTGITYARSNYNLPFTSPQQFMKIKLGNTNSTPFEILGLGLTWTVSPLRVEGP